MKHNPVKHFCRRVRIGVWLLLLCGIPLLSGLCSCSKSDTPQPDTPPEDTLKTDYGMFYKIHRVENFQGDTSDDNPTSAKITLYYSLETKAPREEKYQKTSTWDLAFGALYNSFLSGNNGAEPTNYGGGSSGKGGILILKQQFEAVTDVPSEDLFKTKPDLYGTDDSGDFGAGTGWYQYDFNGTIRGGGKPEKRHVAYALPDTRTIVVRTAKGNYAKIKMISCYKNAFTEDTWFKETPHMYFTFEYLLVPKGSKKFEIK